MSTRVTIFGESIPVTTTGGIRVPSLKKLLRTRTDLTCHLTSVFDGMTDITATRDKIVSADWVLNRLVKETTITAGKLLGVDIIEVYDAGKGVDIYDGEVVRRRGLIANLPHEALPHDTPTTLAYNCNGRPVLWEDISNARLGSLGQIGDSITFDEEITRLLALTDIEQLAVYLQPSRILRDFSRRSPTIDRSPPGGWPR